MLFHSKNHFRSNTAPSVIWKNSKKGTIALLILYRYFIIIEKKTPNDILIIIVTNYAICISCKFFRPFSYIFVISK